MSLYKVELGPLNDEHIEGNKVALFESACEFFTGTSEYFDGAGFAEDGPSLKELTEHAIEADDGLLDTWHNWYSYDATDDIIVAAKYVFSEFTDIEWGGQITADNLESYNIAMSSLVSEIEWNMAENLYEYLVKSYPVR